MKHGAEAANGLRERKKARTREAIIDAALDLFERNGYDDTTIEEIAAAAEVSPRTFFRYFDSKLELIMARTGSKNPDLGPLLAERPAGESLLDSLRELLRSQLDAQMGDPLVLREMQVMLSTPSLRNMAREHFYEEEAELVSAFAARLGTDDGDLTANVMAGAAASTIWTVIDRWLAEGIEVERLSPMIDEAFALLERGFSGARPRARRAASAGPARRQPRRDRQPRP
jgi:AcrR family transcriptional regulator